MQSDVHTNAFNPEMWKKRSMEYHNLGWVNNEDLLQLIIKMLEPRGNEIIVDAGAGSLAVTRAIAPYIEQVVAFDISLEMMARSGELPKNVVLIDKPTSIYETRLPDRFADHLVARMVFHHLDNIEKAINESKRLVKIGGSIIVIEYVDPDEECLIFEREVFDIKEPGRHMWTIASLLAQLLDITSGQKVKLETKLLESYSIQDWLSKSGLSIEKQREIYFQYLNAPTSVQSKMGIKYVSYDSSGEAVEVDQNQAVDILVNRIFAYVQIFN